MTKWTIIIATVLAGCGTLNPQQTNTQPVDHGQFTALLQKHVRVDGLVDYQGFAKDRPQLKAYLDLLQTNAPNDNWSQSDQIAYWINVYNAFTIELILDYYPVESIKDIGNSIQIPFVNTPWDIKLIEIAGEKYDLNNVEHNILRKQWEEPRIHFAINCASYSCPKLRREAYEGAKLEAQLDDQAREFINDNFRNSITPDRAELSKLFSWFKGDFTKKVSLETFINRYSKVPLSSTTDISYKEYDWQLNEAN